MTRKTREWFLKFLEKEDGPSTVEYAVVLALIIVMCMSAIQAIGGNANSAFGFVGDSLGTVMGT